MISSVVFDVGEVLIDETRLWAAWAEWLGVPRQTFTAALEATIAAGRDHRQAFSLFRPGFDLEAERAARARAGQPDTFAEADLYAEVRDCLASLRDLGLRLAVAGNQPAEAALLLQHLGLPVEWIATSTGWGVAKPAAGFFEHIVAASQRPGGEVLYVGDRLDNDIRPALTAGLQAVLVRRGPWGRTLSDPDAEHRCLAVVPDLSALPALIAEHNQQP